MEFYFSDANLPRDRYLAKLLQGNGGCGFACRLSEGVDAPLDCFLSFNKIRALTTDVRKIGFSLRSQIDILRAAILTSHVLEVLVAAPLSHFQLDESKSKVRRKQTAKKEGASSHIIRVVREH